MSTNMRGLGVLVIVGFLTSVASAYVSNRSVWADGEVTVVLQLGAKEAPLTDGSESFDAVGQWVIERWNPFMNRTKLAPQTRPPGVVAEDNDENNVFFDSTLFGDELGDALAVTVGFRPIGRYRSETDIVVNTQYEWDSYRGELTTDTEDLRRVLLHEFGHLIGLGHPDEDGQSVPAIMNSVVSDADALLDDDIVGVVYLYGLAGQEGGVGDADDHGGLLDTATVIETDSTTAGALQDWDRDLFRVTVGKIGALELRSTGELDTFGYLMTGGGTVFAGNDQSGDGSNFRMIYPVFPGETYYVAVEAFAGGTEGDYQLVAELLPDFLNGDEVRFQFDLATVLEPNGSFSDGINYSIDTDVYRIDLTEPGFLFVESSGPTDVLGVLYDGDENILTANDDSGEALNFLIESEYLQPGTYYVEVLSLFTSDLGPYQINSSFEAVDPATVSGARLVNLSVRTGASGDFGPLIMGFVTTDSTKELLLRASGPSLEDFGVVDFLPDPVMSLKDVKGDEIAENDDWFSSEDFLEIPTLADDLGAFEQTSFRDAAIIARPQPGAYTLVVDDFNESPGQVLIEAYDADELERRGRLSNLSTRTEIGIDGTFLTAGFVLAGEGTVRLLIRGIGPELENFGVEGVLGNPGLEVFNGEGEVIIANDDWGTATGDLVTVFSQVGAFPLTLGSQDAAMLVELSAGVYTVQLKGAADETGQGLVEIYVVD